MSTVQEQNQELAKKAKESLKELGYKISLGHAYELISKLGGFPNWDTASASNTILLKKGNSLDAHLKKAVSKTNPIDVIMEHFSKWTDISNKYNIDYTFNFYQGCILRLYHYGEINFEQDLNLEEKILKRKITLQAIREYTENKKPKIKKVSLEDINAIENGEWVLESDESVPPSKFEYYSKSSQRKIVPILFSNRSNALKFIFKNVD